jgi:pimeloyl-ACP methyl ester carboxylesterase
MDARAEAQELVGLGFRELGGAIAGIGGIHRAVANRAFGASGPGATPARVVHDMVARQVYGGLRSGSHALGGAAGRAVSRIETQPLSDTRTGSLALGVINGLMGDRLETEHSALAVPMTLRVDGERAPSVVVFLHGLMETDLSWAFGGGATYGERLAADLGCTPVYVRYNTGRHVSENGRELSAKLEELFADWEVERIALVGHSMGGLVARSAAFCASGEDATWVTKVSHVVSLGTPHMGAPMAQGARWLSSVSGRLPETAAFTAWLRRRSAGIQDLSQGSLVDEDWRGRDPDALRAAAVAEVPLLAGATHCFISASVARDGSLLDQMVGDVLVLRPSASGRSRTRRLGFRDEDGLHLPGVHHFALLNHPKVYDQLRAWLGRGREPATSSV